MNLLARGRDGSRIRIVFNGSPLFTGDAGSGESNISKWIIENDWLEGIVLPHSLFARTLKAWKYIPRPMLKRSSSRWPFPMAKTPSSW